MREGSLVMCIREITNIDPECEGRPNPVKGQIYTVAFAGWADYCIGYYLILAEMHPDSCFNALYFREVQPPLSVNIEDIISTPETVDA